MVLKGKLESKDVEVNDVYFSFVVNILDCSSEPKIDARR